MTNFIKMIRDDRGAAAAEYALILAIVGAAIAVAAVLLGGAIANAMSVCRLMSVPRAGLILDPSHDGYATKNGGADP